MIPPASPDTLSAMGRTSGRISRGLRQLRNAPATWQLVRMLIIIQAAPVIWDLAFPPGSSAPDKLSQAQALLGLTKSYFLAGDLWRPITYALIHGNWPHLIANAATIVLLGCKIEHIVGTRTLRLVAIIAAIAGGLLFILLTPYAILNDQNLVGASAICFAFLVLLTTLSPESKFLPVFVSGKTLGIGIILANLFLALLNPDLPTGPLARFGAYLSGNLFPDLFEVSHACHLGGSLAGYVAGKYLLRPRVTIETLRRARGKRESKTQPKV
jgi:membrane associated rhomboid family serine protease